MQSFILCCLVIWALHIAVIIYKAALALKLILFADANSDFSSDSSTDEDIKKKKAEKKIKKEEKELELNR